MRKNSISKKKQVFLIPKKLLMPIGEFLFERLKRLERRKKDVDTEDPFVDGRSENFASPDVTASEQFGHARAQATRVELDRRIIQVKKALARVKIGKYGICENCGRMIDTDRLTIYPETTLCVSCGQKSEAKKR